MSLVFKVKELARGKGREAGGLKVEGKREKPKENQERLGSKRLGFGGVERRWERGEAIRTLHVRVILHGYIDLRGIDVVCKVSSDPLSLSLLLIGSEEGYLAI